jgi:hypothetical protein
MMTERPHIFSERATCHWTLSPDGSDCAKSPIYTMPQLCKSLNASAADSGVWPPEVSISTADKKSPEKADFRAENREWPVAPDAPGLL